jgi:23S rRNA pseudouridine1911/1915/1917 synthase
LLKILFEDNHLLAVAKQSGQPVQPEAGKPLSLEEEAKAYLKEKYHKTGNVFVGVIHRLDMPVSGIVLLAKTSKALARMNEQFQQREVEKYYEAWVSHMPPANEELITHWMKRDEKKNYSKAFVSEVPQSVKAQLKYKVLEHKNGQTKVRIELLTGRKHQIRAQLSAIGCPIVGDVKYGYRGRALANGSIQLTAVELTFLHPVSKEKITLTYNHR